MTTDRQPVSEDDLQAWTDSRLSSDRVPILEAYFAAHPDAAAHAQTDRANLAALRARLAPVAEEPIPARLRIGNIVAARRDRRNARLLAIAAAVGWIIIGGIGSWVGRDFFLPRGPRDVLRAEATTRDAVAAYRTFSVEVAHPVEVGADQKPHLVQWLSRRLNRTIVIPDLSKEGFQLMGGRLLPTDSDPAAVIMYDDEKGTRLIVYTRADRSLSPHSAFRPERDGDVQTLRWTDAGQSYVVTARADPARLMPIAEAIDGQVRRTEGRQM